MDARTLAVGSCGRLVNSHAHERRTRMRIPLDIDATEREIRASDAEVLDHVPRDLASSQLLERNHLQYCSIEMHQSIKQSINQSIKSIDGSECM